MKIQLHTGLWMTLVSASNGTPRADFRFCQRDSIVEVENGQGMSMVRQRLATEIIDSVQSEHKPIFPSVGTQVHTRHTAHHSRKRGQS